MRPVEVGKRFGAREVCFLQGPLDTESPTSVHLQYTEIEQELGVRPLLLHGLVFEPLPVAEHM